MARAMAAVEKREFGARLVAALAAAGRPTGASQVLAAFNRLRPGTRVTIFAVRKWLLGAAIPTQDKLLLLANWLDVSAQWLRFGETGLSTGQVQTVCVALASRDQRLLDDVHRLDEPSRQVLEDLVISLLAHFPPVRSPADR
ncbi:hypothetical protein [Massilia sp. BSC265]|uniref:hypothetical protein n=1 Tax=Massilia sp. BSC265 TaxID=1549812 RepID=UPI00055CBBCB|nr:hypothetical protein [Massilia sp. BSC265]